MEVKLLNIKEKNLFIHSYLLKKGIKKEQTRQLSHLLFLQL